MNDCGTVLRVVWMVAVGAGGPRVGTTDDLFCWEPVDVWCPDLRPPPEFGPDWMREVAP